MSFTLMLLQNRGASGSVRVASFLLMATCSCAGSGESHSARWSKLIGSDARTVRAEFGMPCEQAPCQRDADVWWYYCDCTGAATVSTNKPCGQPAATAVGFYTGGPGCSTPNYFAPVCPDAKLVIHLDEDGRVDAVMHPTAAPRTWMDVDRSARAN